MFQLYRIQLTVLLRKLIDWFLYAGNIDLFSHLAHYKKFLKVIDNLSEYSVEAPVVIQKANHCHKFENRSSL